MAQELYIEPVVGYRSWRVNQYTYDLTSRIMRDEVWPSDEKLVAECMHESDFCQRTDYLLPKIHDAPAWGCSCGIYAFHQLRDALDQYSNGSLTLVGSAVFWGKIVVNTIGFKAQYARPVAFTNHRSRDRTGNLGWPGILEQVVEKYNVPVVPLDLLEDYTLTFGQQILDHIDE